MAGSGRQRKNQRKKKEVAPALEPRITALSALIAVVLGLITIRLYYLQVIRYKHMAEMAERNRVRTFRMPAARGLVFDSRHRPLVDTRPSFDAELVPEDAHNLPETIHRLEGLLGEDNVAAKLAEAQQDGRARFNPVTVEQGLNWPQVVAIETHELELPGVRLQVTPRRHYIYGPLAAHLLGYVGEVTESDLRKAADYHMGDEIGKFGLELGWEKYLRGDAGEEEMEVNALGRRIGLLKEIPQRPGESLVLTIDLDLQEAAEEALGDKTGALVALDPNTGYVLAMVSHPAFDPNEFANGITPAQWRKLATNPGHPLEDRVIQGIYPPGSTFKIVDTIAGLEEHTLTPSTTYFCPGGLWYDGREYHCWRHGGHGRIALVRAITESCDVYFYHVGIQLGIDRIAYWAHKLGLGEKTGIQLAGEAAGVVPSKAWKEKRYHQRWYPAETLSVAIGQGYVAATPLQMAQVAAQVASGGIRYLPQFVSKIEALDGSVVKAYPPRVEQRIHISAQDLATIRDAMADVVNSPHGTGHAARLPNVTVCGKTGTAQVVREGRTPERDEPRKFRDQGWFIAFAPKNHPQIAIACVIEHGGHGGSSAGPVVHDVLKRFFELHPPQTSPPQQVNREGASLRRILAAH